MKIGRVSVFFASLLVCISSSIALAEKSSMEEELNAAFAAGELDGLHSVLVLLEGEVLAEAHFTGQDEDWGIPLGNREHNASSLHDLRSVTKSITSLLYGIALSKGMVPGLDECLVCQFPEYPDLSKDSSRQQILIRHALSMRMGTDWNEDLPYTDPKNSEIAMELSSDRYRFVLDQPLVETPGEIWNYNGGATAVVARLIEKGSKKRLDEFASEVLFAPLGITDYDWRGGKDGTVSAASGLRLNIHDLAKIGRMVAQGGLHGDKQIVPTAWIDESFKPRAAPAGGLRYGLFWWLAPMGTPPNWAAGFGNGGQRISINRDIDLVVVIFAGRYNDPNAWQLPVNVIESFLGPALDEVMSR